MAFNFGSLVATEGKKSSSSPTLEQVIKNTKYAAAKAALKKTCTNKKLKSLHLNITMVAMSGCQITTTEKVRVEGASAIYGLLTAFNKWTRDSDKYPGLKGHWTYNKITLAFNGEDITSVKFSYSEKVQKDADNAMSSNEALTAKIRGRYLDNGGWRSSAVVKLGSEQFEVKCSLIAASDKLATPESLKSVNWLLDNFEKAIKDALYGDKLVYDNTMSILGKDVKLSQKEFGDQCFKNGFGFFWVGGHADGTIEVDLNIKVNDQEIPTQITWHNGKITEVANND